MYLYAGKAERFRCRKPLDRIGPPAAVEVRRSVIEARGGCFRIEERREIEFHGFCNDRA